MAMRLGGAALCCLLSIVVRAEVPNEAMPTIARFRGDARCAVSFTFDDGTRDQLDLAVPILSQHQVKATFFVCPRGTADTCPDSLEKNSFGARKGTLSWDELRSIAAMGHEIANHSMTHARLWEIEDREALDREINGAAQIMASRLGQAPLTFAYPYLGRNDRVRAVVLERHLGDRQQCVAYGAKNAADFTVEKANALVDQARVEGRWLVPMLHNIEQGWSPVTCQMLREHLGYLERQREEVWVDTFLAVLRYTHQRDSTTLTVTQHGDQDVTFILTSPLDGRLYPDPLTIVVPTADRTADRVEARWVIPVPPRELPVVPVSVMPGKILVNVVPGSVPVRVQWK